VSAELGWRSRGIFLQTPGDDPERFVPKRPLQLQGFSADVVIQVSTFSGVVRITGIAGMDGSHLGVRLGRQERIDVVSGLALLDLPDRRPVGPDAGEARERSGRLCLRSKTSGRSGSRVLSRPFCPKDRATAGQAFLGDPDYLVAPLLIGMDHLVDIEVLNAPK
jgi:hypothetical protein